MLANLNFLRKKARKNFRNGQFTFFDELSINHNLDNKINLINKNCIVLYKPSREYWVLITNLSMIYFKYDSLHEFYFYELLKKEVYNDAYVNYFNGEKNILSANISITPLKNEIEILLPIDVLSVFSFSEIINYLIFQSTPPSKPEGADV